MIVRRDGADYTVQPLGDEWRFWEDQFSGSWEPETKAVIEQYVRGGTYVDLGAWVGPTVLWAAPRASHVVAVEPDPVAFRHLQLNTTANGYDNVTFHRVAVGKPGHGLIRNAGPFGDSNSSTLRGTVTHPVEVVTIASVIDGATDVDLIKIDIEGAEGDVIPREVDYLRELGAPVLLSLHPYLWNTSPLPSLEGWHAEEIAKHEVLFTP